MSSIRFLAPVAMLLLAPLAFAQTQRPILDPEVEPIQFLEKPVPGRVPAAVADRPGGTTVPTGLKTTPVRGQAAVADLPPPQVLLQIRTPSHVPEGKPVPYSITVVNTASTKALRAKLRMPWPEGAGSVVKCEPKADAAVIPGKGELVWTFGNLGPNEKKEISLELATAPNAKGIQATAYIGYEYGAVVETKIDQPKLLVKKTASPQVAAGELATVRVEVTNGSKSAIPNVVLTESNDEDAEYRGDGEAEATKNKGQRMWKLGTLQPGQAQILTYQVLHKRGGEYKTISDVWSPDLANVSHATAESSTKVMVPALQLALTGTAAVSAKSPAQFTATVKNSGTMPLERVQVALELPDDVLVSRVTSGAQRSKDRIVWTVPKLPPGESQEFRAWVELERGASGRKVITAKARDGQQRTEVVTKEATAEFQGASDLRWAPKFDSPRVELNRQGTVTVVVRNEGSETEKGIQLRVRLPQVLKPEADDRSGDKVTLVNDEAIFNLKELQPGKSHEFRLDYTGAKVGEGEVELILVGETLKDKALTKKQTIQVLNRK